MSSPLRRQADVQPPIWEVPVAVGTAWVVIGLLALPTGQGAAAVVFGGGWVWPHGVSALLASIGGLLTGRPAAGLTADQVVRVPTSPMVYSVVGVAELLLVAASIWGAVWWWRLSFGARQGMASRSEADRVLGLLRLRRAHSLIRPDLPRPRWVAGSVAGRFDPVAVGWRLGRSRMPHGVRLWVPYDRTCGVYGQQGSGKTLDLLAPALLAAPGAALVTLTKVDDLLLTLDRRADRDRPVAVLDPFGLAPGVPELVWDPVAGCADSMLAERRAKAFTAGTVKGAVAYGAGDEAARFYASEAGKVLQAYFHAAALTGRSLDDVLEWVADPRQANTPEEVLRGHPRAAPYWDGLLRGALHGDERTAGNTVTTVQQAMSLFFQEPIRARCVPRPGRPATDLAQLIANRGTVYLLGREDPYASASPLMTAVAEDILDTALRLANASAHGRLCPPFLACLDELPSTAPLPTLRTRMANERALGLSFIYAAQTWRQLVITYGDDEARALFGLTNNVVVFGGGKDGRFHAEISALLGTARVPRTTYSTGRGGWNRSISAEDQPVVRPEEIRRLPERHALVIPENARPLIAQLTRCIDGRSGRALRAARDAARARVAPSRRHAPSSATNAAAGRPEEPSTAAGSSQPAPGERR